MAGLHAVLGLIIMNNRLENQTVVIIGGASGMGAAMCELFASEGAKVVIADVNLSAADEVTGHSLALEVDVTDPKSVRELSDRIHDEIGAVDSLVNTVGFARFIPTEQISYDDLRQTLDINLTGVFLCCQAFGQRMIQRRSGKIVNLSSTAGLTGVPGMAHYSAAKHGVVGLTRALAVEWGKYNINVNCICPGATATPMLMQSTDEAWRENRSSRIPLHRLATPEDQARVALFLVSHDANYVNGAVIATDGGVAAMAAGTETSAILLETPSLSD